MDFERYEQKLNYPSKSRFGTKYWYKGGKLIASQKDGESIIDQNGNFVGQGALTGLTFEHSLDEDAFEAAKRVYYAEQSALEAAFKRDLLAELNMTDHPKAEQLFKIATSIHNQYSDGTNDQMFDIAETIVALLK